MLLHVDSEQAQKLRSGELAKLAGVSKDTLRHYERIGALPPAERTDSRYRMYPQASIRRVLIIRAALDLGFSLPELAEVFAMRDSGQAPCAEVKQIAKKRLATVEKQIESLTRLRDHLSTLLTGWNSLIDRREPEDFAHLLETLVPTQLAQSAPTKETK